MWCSCPDPWGPPWGTLENCIHCWLEPKGRFLNLAQGACSNNQDILLKCALICFFSTNCTIKCAAWQSCSTDVTIQIKSFVSRTVGDMINKLPCGRPVLMTQFASMWRNKTSGMCLNADTEWRHMDCAQQPSQSFVQQCSLSSTSSSEPGCYHHQCQLVLGEKEIYEHIAEVPHTIQLWTVG